jgi:Mitochondrial ATPase expression/Pentatricopeptide repeat domain
MVECRHCYELTSGLFSRRARSLSRNKSIIAALILLCTADYPFLFSCRLMRGPAPLLGVLTCLAIPPNSRIPHLAAHILCRRSRDLPKSDGRTQVRRLRTFTTFSTSFLEVSHSRKGPKTAITTVLERVNAPETSTTQQDGAHDEGGNTQHVEDRTDEAHEEHSMQDGTLDTESFVGMQDLLEEGHPEKVRFGLRDHPLARDFICNTHDKMFTSALQLLDAETLFGDYKHVYRHMKPSLMTQPVFRSIRGLETRSLAFIQDLDRIVELRRGSGHRLNLDTCKVLLKAAQVMGDAPLAIHVFDSIMPQDGIGPDLESYNLLMEAVCWNHAFTKSEWPELRVTLSRLRIRRAGNAAPPLEFSGHKVDLQEGNEPPTKSGLRVTILTRFRELVGAGLRGDEATFTNVMIAMGREGDLAGVKSILKSVWNVDVDMLAAYDEEEIESPTFYEEGTPLRPSSRLLFTVVHVFATNNHVGLAFVLLDYISRNYNLSIPYDVWHELCVWTRVLSVYRTQAQKRKGEAEGQVDWRAFERLWQVMTDDPHNVVPDMPLLSLRTANLRRARLLDHTVDAIRDMCALLEGTRERAVNLLREILAAIEALPDHDVEASLPAKMFQQRHDFIIASQTYERDLQEVIVATRRMLSLRTWGGGREEFEWATRRLPTLLIEFADRSPNKISYAIPTGNVELEFRTSRYDVLQDSRLVEETTFHDTTWLGITRQLLDVDDHWVLAMRLKTILPGGSLRNALESGNYDELTTAMLTLPGLSNEEGTRLVQRLTALKGGHSSRT